MRRGVHLLIAVAAGVVAGCGLVPGGQLQPADGGRAGTTGSAGWVLITGRGGAGAGGTAGVSTIEPNCGTVERRLTRLYPEILVVLDASGSMNEDITNTICGNDGCGADSKWARLVPALNQVVAETQGEVHWGLKFFASDTMCGVHAAAEVPVGPNNAAQIADAIAGRTSANGGVASGSRTPTRAALERATTYLSSLPSPNLKFILLATDGVSNCPLAGNAADDDTAGAVTAAGYALTAGFPVFVVGIATAGLVTNGVDANMALGLLANAGGLPRAGEPTYYPVSSAAELAAALKTLVSAASSCTFEIPAPPTNDGTTSRGFINVFVDGTPLPRDGSHTNGWDYADARQAAIVLYGPACDAVMAGTIERVVVTFRCFIE